MARAAPADRRATRSLSSGYPARGSPRLRQSSPKRGSRRSDVRFRSMRLRSWPYKEAEKQRSSVQSAGMPSDGARQLRGEMVAKYLRRSNAKYSRGEVNVT